VTSPFRIDGVPLGPDGIPDIAENFSTPMAELGSTGLRRWGGYVDEEFLPQLRGRKAIAVYREMSTNDPTIGSLLWAIDKLLRQVTWRVDPASSSHEDQQAAYFVEQCMDDMSHTWDDMISEILSMLVYGWSWHEVVYKRRIGQVRSSSLRSKYSDGLIGWRKIPIRAQETLLRWEFDDEGGVQALVQLAPPDYKQTTIPIRKSLLFRTALHKGNPEGQSILRTAYRPWYFKKRIEEIEAIGIERDLAGMPIARVPAELFSAAPGSKDYQTLQAFKKMVRSIRRDQQEGIVMPQSYTQVSTGQGQPEYDFSLLSSSGGRQFDTNAIIERYEQRILMTVLADFILVGHEDGGSYSLHTDKTGIFRSSLNSFASAIANVFNRHEIPRLFALNGWKLQQLPQIKPSDVDAPDLTELGGFMTQMVQAGAQFFPDPELEDFIRKSAKLPPKSPEVQQLQDNQNAQSQAMQMAMAQYQAQQAGAEGEEGGDSSADDSQDPNQSDPSSSDDQPPSDPSGNSDFQGMFS
jgi:hypothetical protein